MSGRYLSYLQWFCLVSQFTRKPFIFFCLDLFEMTCKFSLRLICVFQPLSTNAKEPILNCTMRSLSASSSVLSKRTI